MSTSITGTISDSQQAMLDLINSDTDNTEELESQDLGQDAFMTLLMTQLQYQNPLDPMDNTEFIAQMAQFSTVEQLTTLNETTEYQTESIDVVMLQMESYMNGFANLYEGLIGEVDEDGVQLDNGLISDLMEQNDELAEQNTDILNTLIDIKNALTAYEG